MRSILPLCFLLLGSYISSIQTEIVGPCDVAATMVKVGQTKVNAGGWVCLAKFASGFNTQAVNGPHPDGSYDFGIFQINDKYCRLGTKNSCGVKCTDLVSDNIELSAKCALKIYEKEGFKHWKVWNDTCSKTDRSRFLIKCSFKKQLLENGTNSARKIEETAAER